MPRASILQRAEIYVAVIYNLRQWLSYTVGTMLLIHKWTTPLESPRNLLWNDIYNLSSPGNTAACSWAAIGNCRSIPRSREVSGAETSRLLGTKSWSHHFDLCGLNSQAYQSVVYNCTYHSQANFKENPMVQSIPVLRIRFPRYTPIIAWDHR